MVHAILYLKLTWKCIVYAWDLNAVGLRVPVLRRPEDISYLRSSLENSAETKYKLEQKLKNGFREK